MTAGAGETAARESTAQPLALNAPLFRSLIEERAGTKRRVVLDLGAATTPMLALLGRLRSHVQIADLARSGEIGHMNATVSEALECYAASILPRHCIEEPVDTVFFWDLADYLRPEAARALVRAIAARSEPDTLLHALVSYSARTMPDVPRFYVPNAEGLLLNHAVSTRAVDAPRHSPEDLGRSMGPFVIDRARLLANGMQEFLFRL